MENIFANAVKVAISSMQSLIQDKNIVRAGGKIGEIQVYVYGIKKYHNVATRLSQGDHKVVTRLHAWLSQPGSKIMATL